MENLDTRTGIKQIELPDEYKKVTVPMPLDLDRQIGLAAQRAGRSKAEMIRRAIAYYLATYLKDGDNGQ